MAVRWTIDHSRRLLEAVIEGESSEDDAETFFDALEAGGAVPYRKLIDARTAVAKLGERVLSIVGKRMANYKNPGPFAVVVAGPYVDALTKLFLLGIGADGRARVCRTVDEARAWLDSIKLAAE